MTPPDRATERSAPFGESVAAPAVHPDESRRERAAGEVHSRRSARDLAAWWIPGAFAVALALIFPHHVRFEEWDGVFQYFAGREIVSGLGYHGWPSHFWPPLYPILTGLGSLALSGHDAAKLVSCIAAVFLLYTAFHLAVELTGDRRAGWMTQAFLVVTTLYVRSAIQAENHMLDSLFFVTGLLLTIRALRSGSSRALLVAGAVCALAGLTRYTSYILVLTPLAFFTVMPPRRAARLGGFFVAGFAVVSSPWWLYNAMVNGSPVHTWHYLNIGAHVVPGMSQPEWLWKGQMRFTSLSQIIAAYPVAFASNFVHNLAESVRLIVGSTGFLALFVVPAAIERALALKPGNRQALAIVGLALAAYLALVCQAFVFPEVFLSWVVVATALTAGLFLRYADIARERWPLLRRLRAPAVALFLILGMAARTTSANIRDYVTSAMDDYGQLVDVDPVSEALRNYDPDIATKYVMAAHPAWAYYAGSRLLEMPGYYEGSADGLPTYRGLRAPVRTYAPRYPALTPDDSLSADYLIFDASARRALPQFAFLGDSASTQIPPSFKRIYRSPNGVTVYAIAHR